MTIRNEFDNITNSSIEEAFQYFIKPEILKDECKFQCETCNKKVEEASKGQKIRKFPNILVLQLTRFVYDFQLDRRKKLHD